MSQQDQQDWMDRQPTVERALTLAAAGSLECAGRSVRLLNRFCESRVVEGPVSLTENNDPVTGAYAPHPRDFAREVAEELADARNYCVWGLQLGVPGSRRLADALALIVEAFHELGSDEEELGLVEAVKIPIEYVGAADGCSAVEERGCWGMEGPEGPLTDGESFSCCLRGENDRGAALCEEDARLAADSYVEALGREMDHLAKAEAFADAGARSIEEDLDRLNEAARDLHSIDLLSGLTPLRRRPRVGERVRTALQPGDRKYGIHGQEGKVVDVDRERPRRANLMGEFTHKVRFDFDPKVEQWFTPDELVVLP